MIDFIWRVVSALIGAALGVVIASKVCGAPGVKAAERAREHARVAMGSVCDAWELYAKQAVQIGDLEKRVHELELLVAEGEEPGHVCDDDCVHAGLECMAPKKGKCSLYRKEQEGQIVMEAVSFSEPDVIIRSDGCEHDYYDDPQD